MASNAVGLEAGLVHDDLSRVERKIQLLIESFTKLGDRSPQVFNKSDPQRRAHCQETCSALRQRMRTLRRWRNGSEGWSQADLKELSAFLLHTRADSIEQRVIVLRNSVCKLDDHGAGHVTGESHKMDALKASLRILRQTMKHMRMNGMSLSTLRLAEEKLDHLESVAEDLSDRMEPEATRQKKPPLLRTSLVELRRAHISIEEHPLINSLLRNEARIRRITQAMLEGRHGTLEGGCSAETCAQNDREVLQRQLKKVHRWRRCEADFTAENMNDVELIVAAIGSHLSDDADLAAYDTKDHVERIRRSSSVNRSGDVIETRVFSRRGSSTSATEVASGTDGSAAVNERLV